jgi:hypothetical protein
MAGQSAVQSRGTNPAKRLLWLNCERQNRDRVVLNVWPRDLLSQWLTGFGASGMKPVAKQPRALVSEYPCHVSDRWRGVGA